MPIRFDHGKRVSCVVDGYTVCISGEKIRLPDIDTPEFFSPKCPQEALMAAEARDRLAEFLTGDVSIDRDGLDRYGRALASLQAQGRDVGDVLVQEGYARRWTGRREPWCE